MAHLLGDVARSDAALKYDAFDPFAPLEKSTAYRARFGNPARGTRNPPPGRGREPRSRPGLRTEQRPPGHQGQDQIRDEYAEKEKKQIRECHGAL